MSEPVRTTALTRRLTAPNPGPMTLDGTNSWLLGAPGQGDVVVVDPGPEDAGHLEALAAAGIAAEFGPFGSSFEVDHQQLGALSDAISAAVEAGATRVSTQVEAAT